MHILQYIFVYLWQSEGRKIGYRDIDFRQYTNNINKIILDYYLYVH